METAFHDDGGWQTSDMSTVGTDEDLQVAWELWNRSLMNWSSWGRLEYISPLSTVNLHEQTPDNNKRGGCALSSTNGWYHRRDVLVGWIGR